MHFVVEFPCSGTTKYFLSCILQKTKKKSRLHIKIYYSKAGIGNSSISIKHYA